MFVNSYNNFSVQPVYVFVEYRVSNTFERWHRGAHLPPARRRQADDGLLKDHFSMPNRPPPRPSAHRTSNIGSTEGSPNNLLPSCICGSQQQHAVGGTRTSSGNLPMRRPAAARGGNREQQHATSAVASGTRRTRSQQPECCTEKVQTPQNGTATVL